MAFSDNRFEQLRPLIALADFFADPTVYKQTLVELKDVLARYDTVLQIAPSIEAADAYVVKANDYGAKIQTECDAKVALVEQTKKASDVSIAKAQAEIDAQQQALTLARQALVAQKALADQHDTELSQLKTELVARTAELAVEQADFSAKQALLKAKADAIAAAIAS